MAKPGVVHRGRLTFKGFEALVVAEWKKAWRTVVNHHDDPVPRAYFYARERVFMTELPPGWFSAVDAKLELFDRIAYMGKTLGCHYIAICNSMMGLAAGAITDEEAEEMDRTNEIPTRIVPGLAENLTDLAKTHPQLSLEAAHVLVIDREAAYANAALVERKPGRPPRLTDWTRSSSSLDGGRMIDPIQAAIR